MSTIFINTKDDYPSIIALTNDLKDDQWPKCSKMLAQYKAIGTSKNLAIADKLKKLENIARRLVKEGHEIKEW